MIDSIIIVLYLILVLSVGVYYRSKSMSFRGYSEVKGSRSIFLLVATVFATSVGGGTTFGIAEKSFAHDISFTYGLLFTIPVDILIAFYIVPRLIEHYGAISVGDIMSKYYGSMGRVISGISSVFISTGYIAAQINVSGRIFEHTLGFAHNDGVIFSYIVVIIFTSIGGLRSVISTNILQFIAMVLAIPVITITGIYSIGIDNFASIIEPKYYMLDNRELICNVICTTLSFSVMGFHPAFIQQALINKNDRKIKPAIVIKSIVYAFFILCITINGILAFNIDPNQSSAFAIPNMIDMLIPSGLKGFVMIGLLAAVTSTASADLNISSISIINDIFRPIFNSKNQKFLLFSARIVTVVIGSFAIILALNFDHVVDLVIFSGGFWAPVIFVPLIAALFKKKISKKGFLVCGVIGFTAFCLWEYSEIFPSLKGVFVGTFANLLSFICCILLYKVK